MWTWTKESSLQKQNKRLELALRFHFFKSLSRSAAALRPSASVGDETCRKKGKKKEMNLQEVKENSERTVLIHKNCAVVSTVVFWPFVFWALCLIPISNDQITSPIYKHLYHTISLNLYSKPLWNQNITFNLKWKMPSWHLSWNT